MVLGPSPCPVALSLCVGRCVSADARGQCCVCTATTSKRPQLKPRHANSPGNCPITAHSTPKYCNSTELQRHPIAKAHKKPITNTNVTPTQTKRQSQRPSKANTIGPHAKANAQTPRNRKRKHHGAEAEAKAKPKALRPQKLRQRQRLTPTPRNATAKHTANATAKHMSRKSIATAKANWCVDVVFGRCIGERDTHSVSSLKSLLFPCELISVIRKRIK